MPSPPSIPARESSAAAVWAPWLAAPLFALLPMAGCGLAGLVPAAAHPPAAAPEAPVVTVVTAEVPQVAWDATAH